MDSDIECVLGIIDSYGVVSSKVVYENDNPLEYVHEEIWPISGRGKRWRYWSDEPEQIEKSDIDESFLNEEDKERIINHLIRRFKVLNENFKYVNIKL